MDTILFIICAIVAILSALNMILQRHPISSALSLVGVMGALAVLYLLLGAEFLAMAQMFVYAGAVMVLFIFVIMVLNMGSEKTSRKAWFAQIAGLPLVLAFLGILLFITKAALPPFRAVQFGTWVGGSAYNIGRLLFTTYLLPFEVISVVVLIAIAGAVILARKEIR